MQCFRIAPGGCGVLVDTGVAEMKLAGNRPVALASCGNLPLCFSLQRAGAAYSSQEQTLSVGRAPAAPVWGRRRIAHGCVARVRVPGRQRYPKLNGSPTREREEPGRWERYRLRRGDAPKRRAARSQPARPAERGPAAPVGRRLRRGWKRAAPTGSRSRPHGRCNGARGRSGTGTSRRPAAPCRAAPWRSAVRPDGADGRSAPQAHPSTQERRKRGGAAERTWRRISCCK
jgi:hypothetical protein